MPERIEFELLIRPDNRGNYRAQVLNSPAGEVVLDFRLPFTDPELADAALRPHVGDDQTLEDRVFAREFSLVMAAKVFAGRIDTEFRRMRDRAKREGKLLLVKVISTPSRDRVVPWEYLRHAATLRDADFLFEEVPEWPPPPTATLPTAPPRPAYVGPKHRSMRRWAVAGGTALAVALTVSVVVWFAFLAGDDGEAETTTTLTAESTLPPVDPDRMDELIGLGLDEAVAAAATMGVSVDVELIAPPAGEAPGTVIDWQILTAGRVTLFVAEEAPPTVPDLTGVALEDAIELLAGMQLQAQREDDLSVAIPVGHVIRTIPPPGTEMSPGDRVILAVSAGPALVPDVTGLTEERAFTELVNAKLTPRVVVDAVPVEEPSEAGLVVRQLPAPGTEVGPNTFVEISLSYLVVPDNHQVHSGALGLPSGTSADLDGGLLGATDTDIGFEAPGGTPTLIVTNGANVAISNTAVVPSDCLAVSVGADPIPMSELTVGSALCVLTSAGRWSIVTIDNPASNSSDAFQFRFRTYAAGVLGIPEAFSADFDLGAVVSRADADFTFRSNSATDRELAPTSGARVGLLAAEPNRRACSDAATSDPVDVADLEEGSVVCYVTDEGRVGYMRLLEPIGDSPGTLSVQYLTWELVP